MKKKILSVDDSKTIRLIIQKAFRNHDCQIFEAGDGQEGLAMAAKEKPDIIILDLTMPVMDGYEMLTKMKALPELQNIPVIMLTAEAGKDNVLRIAKMGVRDYVIKPFKEDVIVAKVGKIIELPLKPAAPKKYDDEIRLLVVEDKPAIIAQIQKALGHTRWKVEGLAQAAQAVDACAKQVSDIIIASLSLPEEGAYDLFTKLRGDSKTKGVPFIGLCLESATEEQSKARQAGFAGVVTKPIQPDKLEAAICRALNLDTASRYFQEREGTIVLTMPEQLDSTLADKLSLSSREKVMSGVESGIGKLVIDLSPLKSPNLDMVQFVVSVAEACSEFSLSYALIGSEAVIQECKKYEESQGWRITENLADAMAA